MIVFKFFNEITGNKLDVVEFCKVKNMHFGQNGRRGIQPIANLGKIIEKSGIRQFFVPFQHVLPFDFSVFNKFRPNLHFLFLLEFKLIAYKATL